MPRSLLQVHLLFFVPRVVRMIRQVMIQMKLKPEAAVARKVEKRADIIRQIHPITVLPTAAAAAAATEAVTAAATSDRFVFPTA